MPAIRRRSIVEFERWVDREIADLESSLEGLVAGQAAVQARLNTMRDVKAKLQLPEKDENCLPSPAE